MKVSFIIPAYSIFESAFIALRHGNLNPITLRARRSTALHRGILFIFFNYTP